MRQTEHYGLNLWDLSDRIKMEDFNGDNQKLDTALAALAAGSGRVQKICGIQSELTPKYMIGMPIWGNNNPPQWDDWSIVLIMGSVTEIDDNGIPYFALGRTAYNSPAKPAVKFEFEPGAYLCILVPLQDSSRNVNGIFISSGMVRSFYLDETFNDILYFSNGCALSNGTGASSMIRHMQAIAIR